MSANEDRKPQAADSPAREKTAAVIEETSSNLKQGLNDLKKKLGVFQDRVQKARDQSQEKFGTAQESDRFTRFTGDIINHLRNMEEEVAPLLNKVAELRSASAKQGNWSQDDVGQVLEHLKTLEEKINPLMRMPKLLAEVAKQSPAKPPDTEAAAAAPVTDSGPPSASFRAILGLASVWSSAVVVPLVLVLTVVIAVILLTRGPAQDVNVPLERIEAHLKNGSGGAALPGDLVERLDKSCRAVDVVEKSTREADSKLATLASELTELQKAVKKMSSRELAPLALPKDWDKQMEAMKKLPQAAETIVKADEKFNSLEEKFKEQKKQLKEIMDAMKSLQKGGTVALPKELDDRIKDLHKVSVAADKDVVALDARVNSLNEKLGAFTKQMKDLENAVERIKMPAGPTEPQDTVIVALHTTALDVNVHSRAYQELFRDLPRGKDGMRFGFAMVSTAKITSRIKLADEKVVLNTIGAPFPNATEDPESIGRDLKNELFDSARRRQRIILVASTECPAPHPRAAGWIEIPQVDVVLIQVKKKEIKTDHLLAWHEFCRERRGSLNVILVGEADRQTDQLANVLRQLCGDRK